MRYERKSEYGGYLPLELNSGTEMFERYSKYLKRFNSVKAFFSIYYRTRKTVKNNDPILLLSVDDRGFKAEWSGYFILSYIQ